MSAPTRLLFVCLGNIIRSPLAEGIFRHLVSAEGLNGKYEVDSAGTSEWHVGESPDARMRRTAAAHGVEVTGRARQFQQDDFERYDWIVAMDTQNRADLLAQAASPEQRSKIRLLREFDPRGGPDAGVPDPYYGGAEGFEHTYQIVERSLRGLLDAMERGEA
jgi:protein-tyrosine phosphatase